MRHLIGFVLFLMGITLAYAEPVTVPLDGATVTFDSSLLPDRPTPDPTPPVVCEILRGDGDPLPEVGKPCDSWVSNSGFYWGPKTEEGWPETFTADLRVVVEIPGESSDGSVDGDSFLYAAILATQPADVAHIACNFGDDTAAIQAAQDARKWAVADGQDCVITKTVTGSRSFRFIGKGEGAYGTNVHCRVASGPCILAGKGSLTDPNDGDASAVYIAGMRFYGEGNGDITKQHAIVLEGCSNNSVLEALGFREKFFDHILLLAAEADSSAAFRCTIRNVFAFHARGCDVRVAKRPGASQWPLVLLTIEEVDMGRALEGSICFDALSTNETNVTITGAIFDGGQTPHSDKSYKMPVAIKVKTGFPRNGPFPVFDIRGVKTHGVPILFQSDIPASVNLSGFSGSGQIAKPGGGVEIVYCDKAIDLPGDANDVTCQAAHGNVIER